MKGVKNMKTEIKCIKNRVKWSLGVLNDLKEIKKKYKIIELNNVCNDLTFNIKQIGFYVKKIENGKK